MKSIDEMNRLNTRGDENILKINRTGICRRIPPLFFILGLLLCYGLLLQPDAAYGWQEELLNVREYGATGDGETDDTGAFRDLLGEVPERGANIEIPPGTYLVDGITFPENVGLVFRAGGRLDVSGGSEIRIDGSIDAGIGQIFSGEGTVTGSVDNLYIFPQWFGA
ncbi:MAG: glycosyl hydrolase family 28-related protein, partial [Balneolaceae bacterium]|nr:glycosyl hydrolase family 28-related protein [Balneolaceae bacterium]